MTKFSASVSLAAASLVAAPQPGWAVTLADPVTFSVKRTFEGSALGVPRELGGAVFSADGSVLYVVGDADRSTSAVFAVPVIRDSGTQEIVDLGPAGSVTKVFDGVAPMGGLDAGLDVGPGGTVFYTYWNANLLGQRPGGFAGAEAQFDLGTIGVPTSSGGLTFSPRRCDAVTGFGQLQVSVYDGDLDSDPSTGDRNIYDVALGAEAAGLFAPAGATLFATLPPGTPEAPIGSPAGMHYIPSGTLAGNLLYASWDVGQVRYLAIDQVTGLPIDAGTTQPQLGTTNPVDHPFASDVGEGPLGMDFDPVTHDLFLTTAQGIPLNSIVQIGGFAGTVLPPVDCTLPGCALDLAFGPLACRIDALSAALGAAGVPGKSLTGALGKLTKADERLTIAETAMGEDNAKKARKQVGKAAKFVDSVGKKLASPRKGPKLVADATARAALQSDAAALAADVLAFRDTF
jgi:hypothetical protein